jgi:phage terminase large subunit GpA-like protein
MLMVSSPTVKGASRIEAAFLESDQRFYHVPCPQCRRRQLLVWQRIEWPENKPEEAQYRCAGCEQLIPHHRKAWMVANGHWVVTNRASNIAGFHLSELCSPWRPWSALAVEWLAAQGNIERLSAFINTSLAELWDDQAAGAVYALAAIHGLASHGVSLDMEAERVALLCQNLQPVPVATYQVYRSQFMRSFHA